MAWIFSKRCKKALSDKTIKVSLPKTTRIRIWKTLGKHNEEYHRTNSTGFSHQTSTLEELPESLKAEIGCEELLAFTKEGDGTVEPSNLESFILRGNYPPYIFDVLEICYENINANNQISFQRDINQLMEESNLPWRMAEGKIFLVDSHYIDEIILRRSQELLNEVRFQGALQEFEKARTDLTNGDYLDAIQNANLAVESTIKGILGIEKAKPGELFRRLINSGLVPEYYKDFLKVFEENILRCVAVMRNEEQGAGHGQGVEVNKIPAELAELGVHLSGVLIHYLIKRYLSDISSDKEVKNLKEEVPF